jgi:hypothetical protein
MPAHLPLFHAVFDRITQTCPHLRKTARTRLSLLVCGILGAQSCVQLAVADELLALDLTHCSSIESVTRRLRRILNDDRLDPTTCYESALPTILDWSSLTPHHEPITLLLDESSAAEHIHLVRVALAYRGSALPLVWAAWEQNVAQPAGHYWTQLDALLTRVAALMPPDREVLILADRAYDIPPIIDRLSARGWHWVIRLKTRASTRFLDHQGIEQPLTAVLERRLQGPGWRCKARGKLFKDAGWREVSLVGLWAAREDEALVVISDLSPSYALLDRYRRRFWIETSFRNDKAAGWHWEDCQVTPLAHHRVLLLALAWATLITLCLGSERAEEEMARQAAAPPHRPQHARFSLFRLGRQVLRLVLHHPERWTIRWSLSALAAPSWNRQWLALQGQRLLSQTVRS